MVEADNAISEILGGKALEVGEGAAVQSKAKLSKVSKGPIKLTGRK